MAGGDDDLGLGLRLPWGRVSPPAERAFAPPPSATVAPPAGFAPPPAEAPEAGPPFDPTALQHSLEALLEAIGGRFDRLDDRLDHLEHGLPERLDLLGTLDRNHERLVAALDASHATLVDRMAQLAPAELVARLIQGVVTTGEMLDAEMIDLKRLLADMRPPGP